MELVKRVTACSHKGDLLCVERKPLCPVVATGSEVRREHCSVSPDQPGRTGRVTSRMCVNTTGGHLVAGGHAGLGSHGTVADVDRACGVPGLAPRCAFLACNQVAAVLTDQRL